jgi:hypothetical protein
MIGVDPGQHPLGGGIRERDRIGNHDHTASGIRGHPA